MHNTDSGTDDYPESLTSYFNFTPVFVTRCCRMELHKAGVARPTPIDTAASSFI